MTAPAKARRLRPNMPHYGVLPNPTAAMLTWDWVEAQMQQARNYWICTTRPSGSPHAVPVWGVWVESRFFFGTEPRAVKTRNIQHNPQAVVHLESGDHTLIFEGILLESSPAAESSALNAAIDRAYRQKYDFSPEGAGLRYRLVPQKVLAWLEADFPNTATCWLFEDG